MGQQHPLDKELYIPQSPGARLHIHGRTEETRSGLQGRLAHLVDGPHDGPLASILKEEGPEPFEEPVAELQRWKRL